MINKLGHHISTQCCNMESIKDLQENAGFLEGTGIIEQSIQGTDLFSWLNIYANTADNLLYFNNSYWTIRDIYQGEATPVKISLAKRAILNAIRAEEYNLQTLVDSMNVDYDPMENYDISHEDNVKDNTTDDFNNSNTVNHGEQTITTDNSQTIGAVSTTGSQTLGGGTDSTQKSIGVVTVTGTETLGGGTDKLTKSIGAVGTTGTDNLQVSPYNSEPYSNKEMTTKSENVSDHTDIDTNVVASRSNSSSTNTSAHTDTDTMTIAKRENKTTESVAEHVDSETGNVTRTAYIDSSKGTNQGTRNKVIDSTGRKHGRYGITSQELILQQRRLADVDVAQRVARVALNVLASGMIGAM